MGNITTWGMLSNRTLTHWNTLEDSWVYIYDQVILGIYLRKFYASGYMNKNVLLIIAKNWKQLKLVFHQQ